MQRLGNWANKVADVLAPLDEEYDSDADEPAQHDFVDGFAPSNSEPFGSAVVGGGGGGNLVDVAEAEAAAVLQHQLAEKESEIAGLTSQLGGLKAMIRSRAQEESAAAAASSAAAPDAPSHAVVEAEAATAAARAELASVTTMRDLLLKQAQEVAEGVRRLADEARPLQLAHCAGSASGGEAGDAPSVLEQMQEIVQRLSSTIVYLRERQAEGWAEGRGGRGGGGEEGERRAALEAELGQASARCLAAQERSHQLESKVAQLEAAGQGMHAEVAALRAEAAQSRAAAASAHEQEQRAAAQRDQLLLQQAQQNNAQKSKAAEHEIGRLKEVIAQLRNNKNSKVQEVSAVLQEREALRARVEALTEEGDALRRQGEEQGEAIRKHGELAQLHEGATRAQAEWQRTEAELRSQLLVMTQRHQAAQKAAHDACTKLRAAEADLQLARQDHERNATACGNLQRVLEQFQAEKEAELRQTRAKCARELEAHDEAAQVKLEHAAEAHEIRVSEMTAAHRRLEMDVQRAAQDLAHRLKEKDGEVLQMRRTLDEAVMRLTRDDVVDRGLVTNLIVTYHARNRSPEVLELMAKMLDFSDEDKRKVGLKSSRQSLGGEGPQATAPAGDAAASNVLELWVSFLAAEDDAGVGGGAAASEGDGGAAM